MEGQRICPIPRYAGADGLSRIGINICKAFMKPFRMTSYNSAGTRSQGKSLRPIRCPILRWPMKRLISQNLGQLLHPFQSAVGSANTNPKAVLNLSSSLSHPKCPACAIFEPKQGTSKVMDQASGHDVSNLSCDFYDFQARNKTDQIMRVTSNISHHQRWSAPDWIVAPWKSLAWNRFIFVSLSTLNIFNLNQSNSSNLSIIDHGFCLTNHGIARVIVSQTKYQPRLLYLLMKCFSFRERICQRLITDHIKAMFQAGNCIFIMTVIGGHDSDYISAVCSCRF